MTNLTETTISVSSLGNPLDSLGVSNIPSQDNAALAVIDEQSVEATVKLVEGMNEKERKAWAETITLRLRDCILNVADAYYTFEERKRVLLQTVKEAYEGGAWRIKGYDSWEEYWHDQFTDAKMYNNANERNEIILHLKANGFSQKMIAPIVGMTRQGVGWFLNHAKQEETVQHASYLHAEQSDGQTVGTSPISNTAPTEPVTLNVPDPSPATSSAVPVQPKISEPVKGLDEKEYRQRKTHDELVADWYFLKSLISDRPGRKPLSYRQIEAQYGEYKIGTINRTLAAGQPTPTEQASIWLKAKRILTDGTGNGLGLVCRELGMRMEAVVWMLEPSQVPPLMNLIEQDSIYDWVTRSGQLKLIDGRATTQKEISELTGKSQPTISQTLTKWCDAQGLFDTDDVVDTQSSDEPEYGLASDASLAESAAKAGQDLEDRYRRGDGVGAWMRQAEAASLEIDPATDNGSGASPWLAPFSRCLSDLLDKLMGPMNVLFTWPALMGQESLEKITPQIDKLAELTARWAANCHSTLGR